MRPFPRSIMCPLTAVNRDGNLKTRFKFDITGWFACKVGPPARFARINFPNLTFFLSKLKISMKYFDKTKNPQSLKLYFLFFSKKYFLISRVFSVVRISRLFPAMRAPSRPWTAFSPEIPPLLAFGHKSNPISKENVCNESNMCKNKLWIKRVRKSCWCDCFYVWLFVSSFRYLHKLHCIYWL